MTLLYCLPDRSEWPLSTCCFRGSIWSSLSQNVPFSSIMLAVSIKIQKSLLSVITILEDMVITEEPFALFH